MIPREEFPFCTALPDFMKAPVSRTGSFNAYWGWIAHWSSADARRSHFIRSQFLDKKSRKGCGGRWPDLELLSSIPRW
jgi:hypothetical protein